MAEWTQERIATVLGNANHALMPRFALPRQEFIGLLTLAARGLAAEQDAVKARALEAWVTAQRAINASWQTDDLYNHDKQNALLLAGKLAHDAAFALCPASTKEGA